MRASAVVCDANPKTDAVTVARADGARVLVGVAGQLDVRVAVGDGVDVGVGVGVEHVGDGLAAGVVAAWLVVAAAAVVRAVDAGTGCVDVRPGAGPTTRPPHIEPYSPAGYCGGGVALLEPFTNDQPSTVPGAGCVADAP